MLHSQDWFFRNIPPKIILSYTWDCNLHIGSEYFPLCKDQIFPIATHCHSLSAAIHHCRSLPSTTGHHPLSPTAVHRYRPSPTAATAYQEYVRKCTKHFLEFNPFTKYFKKRMPEKVIFRDSILENRISENENLNLQPNAPLQCVWMTYNRGKEPIPLFGSLIIVGWERNSEKMVPSHFPSKAHFFFPNLGAKWKELKIFLG